MCVLRCRTDSIAHDIPGVAPQYIIYLDLRRSQGLVAHPQNNLPDVVDLFAPRLGEFDVLVEFLARSQTNV